WGWQRRLVVWWQRLLSQLVVEMGDDGVVIVCGCGGGVRGDVGGHADEGDEGDSGEGDDDVVVRMMVMMVVVGCRNPARGGRRGARKDERKI
nr:hypothetical protein [Tanacetum cinerariifolium]